MTTRNSPFDVQLPLTDAIERQVIADAVNYPALIGEMTTLVSENSFTTKERKELWRTVIELYNAGHAIDGVVMVQLTGRLYINEVETAGVQFSAESMVLYHARLLHVAETKKRAYYAALTIVQQSALTQTSEDDILAMADELSAKIQGDRRSNTESILSDVLGMVADETEQMQQEALAGRAVKVPTGIPTLDFLLYGGFGKGQLIILAARPSIGKTALMLQFAKCAATNGIPATVFSLEMTKEELGKRLLFSTGYVSQAQLAGKSVDWDSFERARGTIDRLPLYINDEVRSPEAIISRMTSAVQQRRCGIAFIDYLGLMRFDSGGRNATLAQQIGFVTSELKSAAKRLKIPVVVLVQLSRQVFQDNQNASPQLHHLRDSGSIEQDADVVMMLAQGDWEPNEGSLPVKMFVRKNRGFVKDVEIKLDVGSAYTVFNERDVVWPKGYSPPSNYTPPPTKEPGEFVPEPEPQEDNNLSF